MGGVPVSGAKAEVAREERRGRGFLIAAGASALAYLALLVIVRLSPETRLDVATTLRFQRRRHPLLARLMVAVSWFGFRPQSLLVPASAIAALLRVRLRLEAACLGLAWLGSFGNFLTKLVIQRPRPNGHGIIVAPGKILHSSFPSGHVVHYVAFYGFLSYVVFSHTARGLRWAVAGLVGFFVALVGASRVYLGHHWLTDVLASYLLGFAYLIGVITLYRQLRARGVLARGSERGG